ncbi:MAG TPA: ATP-binding protein, partial [Gemmatimonadaceae bacterium]|nr:ATP-binding protein [Gemmatimonadaceae bacterium]
ATMSHEFRTPLNALTGYVQLLDMGLAGPVTDTQRDFLQRLNASGRHLTGLVDDVLDLAKVEAGQLTVASEQLMLGDSIEEALALAVPQAQSRGIGLVDARRGAEDVPYIGDNHRVRQILLNLISNALKFTPAGGKVTLRCDIADTPAEDARVSGNGPYAYIEVSDTGVGIAKEHEAAVFEPFFQAEAAMGRRYRRTAGGIGLGLTISRRLARLMGGDLTLRSAPNEGSTFVLWLPAPHGRNVELDVAQMEHAPQKEVSGYKSRRLVEITHCLRRHADEFLQAHLARLRTDSKLADAVRPLSEVELEDHLASFIPDLLQTLAAIQDAGGLESPNQYDSCVIQRVIAELHGRQRHRLGWSEAQLLREQSLFADGLRQFAEARIPDDLGDRTTAIEILERLTTRSTAITLRGFRHAAQAEAPFDKPHLSLVPPAPAGPADQVVRRETARDHESPEERSQRR